MIIENERPDSLVGPVEERVGEHELRPVGVGLLDRLAQATVRIARPLSHEDHLDRLAELRRLELCETLLDVVALILEQVQVEVLRGELNELADLLELGARTNVERRNRELRIVRIGGLEPVHIPNDEVSQQIEHHGAVLAAVEAQADLVQAKLGASEALLDDRERLLYELGLLRLQVLE